MSDGRTEQVGSPDEIYHKPASAFVAGFIGEANLLDGEVATADGATVSVRVDDHGLTVPAPARALRSGEAVSLMIRPERVRVAAGGGAEGSSLPVTVTEMIFRGPSTRVHLATASGTEVVAHLVDGDEDGRSLRPGDTAVACWEPEAAFVVPRAPLATAKAAAGLDADAIEAIDANQTDT
jgi:ABC-type Fe3+/spermidine/putrescine transport system ATPase subunit